MKKLVKTIGKPFNEMLMAYVIAQTKEEMQKIRRHPEYTGAAILDFLKTFPVEVFQKDVDAISDGVVELLDEVFRSTGDIKLVINSVFHPRIKTIICPDSFFCTSYGDCFCELPQFRKGLENAPAKKQADVMEFALNLANLVERKDERGAEFLRCFVFRDLLPMFKGIRFGSDAAKMRKFLQCAWFNWEFAGTESTGNITPEDLEWGARLFLRFSVN